MREEYPNAVIVRPSNIYGESDRFLFYYLNDYRRGLNSIPLWHGGEMTIKMPVHVLILKINTFIVKVEIFILFYVIIAKQCGRRCDEDTA